jgi:hypothetical protein
MCSTRFAARLLVALLLICGGVGAFASPAQARMPATPGMRCLDSLQIQSNLPFSDISRGGEIVDIDGFMLPLGGVVGFIYTTRRGEHFMQVDDNDFDGASDVLRSVGATRLADAAKFGRPAGAVYPIAEPDGAIILAKLIHRDQLYRCFTRPLP